MLPVDFKKRSCHSVEFMGQGPLSGLVGTKGLKWGEGMVVVMVERWGD